MNRWLIAGLAFGITQSGCDPEEEVPFETISVRVEALDPFGVRPEGPLNVALLWTTTGTIFASPSVPLPEEGTLVELPLSFIDPPPMNLFFAEFGLARDTIVVLVPRIAVFRDDDESGGFTAWDLEEDSPPDRIFSVNGQGATSVARVRDFEASFSELSAVDVNTYYGLTGGVHTPFIRFVGRTSTQTPSVLLESGPPIVSMYFEEPVLPERDIRCINARAFQPAPEVAPIGEVPTSSESFELLVDDRVDLEGVCGLSTPDCTAVDITTVTTTVPEDKLTPGRRIISQCRAGANFESLITLQAELRCDECACDWVARHRAVVVRTSSTPADWPCGEEVEFCPSSLPLFQVDESCAFEEEEEEEEDDME